MTEVQELAAFVDRVQLGDLSERALEQFKIRVLDTIGGASLRSKERRRPASYSGHPAEGGHCINND